MKKWIIIGVLIIFFIVATIIGVRTYINMNNTNNNGKIIQRELAENIIENTTKIVSTSANEEIISPNAILIFETYYDKCGHIEVQRINIPENLVNKTEKEIKERFDEWKLESFSSNEINLKKEKDEICNEHYVLKEHNGYIAIYTIDEDGIETLKEMTSIIVAYLTDTDKDFLRDGIKVYGKENLNAMLEDYE